MSKNIHVSCYLFNANDLSISGVISDCCDRTSRLGIVIHVIEYNYIDTILSYSVGRFFTIISFLYVEYILVVCRSLLSDTSVNLKALE